MRLPSVCIVTDAARDNANRVWIAMGKATPDSDPSFIRKLTTDQAPTPDAPVTHWLLSDTSTLDSDIAILQAFSAGILPPLPEGSSWGEAGTISAEDAVAAISASNLQIYSAAGDVEPMEHVNGILLGRGLSLVPASEF